MVEFCIPGYLCATEVLCMYSHLTTRSVCNIRGCQRIIEVHHAVVYHIAGMFDELANQIWLVKKVWQMDRFCHKVVNYNYKE